MKIYRLLLLLNLTVFFTSCNGQSKDVPKAYSQKTEYGISGPVKEIATYFCKTINHNIPADTTNFFRKDVMIFNQTGDLSIYTKNISENGKTMHIKMLFEGKGKNISAKELVTFDNEDTQEMEYKYIWRDDYNYEIITQDNYQKDTIAIMLDHNYRIVKTHSKIGGAENSENIENILKDNKIIKTISHGITKIDKKEIKYKRIEIIKKYDNYNNPTLIYSFENSNEKNPTTIIFKEYKYF